jgi:hypothetical protein
VISLCTRRGRGFLDFAAVYGHGPGVVVDCSGAKFDRLVISRADAAETAGMIERHIQGEAMNTPWPSG